MTSKLVDPCVSSLMRYHCADGESGDLINRLCEELIDDADEVAPIDLEVLASFRNARVEYADQEQAETIHWDGRNFRIRLRKADTLGRQRFSCAHAIVHTWFFESAGFGQRGTSVQQNWSSAEEELCDLGAASLLLPEGSFRAVCPAGINIRSILEVADQFRASAEATALRAVTLSKAPMAMVVLELKLKPSEEKVLAEQRFRPWLARTKDVAVTPRLRVVKSFRCGGLAYVPRHKSVGEGNQLSSVLEYGEVNYTGEIGIIPGIYRVSARNLPVRRNGNMVDRVVALIAPSS